MADPADELRRRCHAVEERISEALVRVGRDRDSVKIVAASKHQSAHTVNTMSKVLREGATPFCLGESYVQEYRSKRHELASPPEVHLVGALQSNKAKLAVELFDCIESVSSARLAKIVNSGAEVRAEAFPVYLQVNISGDSSKSGFSPAEVERFVLEELPLLKLLKVEGLMTITKLYSNLDHVRPDFAALRELGERLWNLAGWSGSCGLSMGMSQDFEVAIAEGATLVRLGTALFGPRAA